MKNIRKKALPVLFCMVLMLAMVFCVTASAEVCSGTCGATEEDSLTWSYDDATHTLTISGTGDMADYFSGSQPWYGYRSEATALVLNPGITSIGEYAFYGFHNLIGDLTIPDSVEYIGASAFFGCCNLTGDLKIPDGVTFIGGSAFRSCSGFCGTLTIGDAVTEICGNAFDGCYNLTGTVTLGKNIETIGDDAFCSCSGVTAFSVSEENEAFKSENGMLCSKDGTALICCPGGKSGVLTIPAGVTAILDNAFTGCSKLTGDLVIPDSVISIGEGVFWNCQFDGILKIGKGVTSIGDSAFGNCWGITEVEVDDENTGFCSVDGVLLSKDKTVLVFCPQCISEVYYAVPEGVKEIAARSFPSGRTIFIPTSVEKIDEELDSFETVLYAGGQEDWDKIELNYNGELILNATGEEVKASGTINSDDETPATISWSLRYSGLLTVSGSGRLSDESSENPWNDFYSFISDIVFEEGISYIGQNSIAAPYYLKTVSIPASASMDEYLFSHNYESLSEIIVAEGNKDYKSVDGVLYTKDGKTLVKYPAKKKGTSYRIESTVTKIGDQAFRFCSYLAEITLPEALTHIDVYAFSNCSSLRSVTIPAAVNVIDDTAFCRCPSLTAVTVAEGNTSYKSLDGVLFTIDGKDLIIYPAESSRTAYTIPDSVENICSYAFDYASKLTAITLQDGVKSIGYYAFDSCSSLTSIDIPDSVTSIASYAFRDCYALASVTLPSKLTELNCFVFSRCSSLTDITIPNTVKTIEGSAFEYCRSLKSINIPDGVTCVSDRAFFDCSSLEEVSIPSSVTEIGELAFGFCASVQAFSVAEENKNYASKNGVLFSKDGTKLINYPMGKVAAEYVVPEGTTALGTEAFNCFEDDSPILRAITIPATVTQFEGWVFSDLITDIYYCGSNTDWNRISGVGSVYDGVTIHFEIEYPVGKKLELNISAAGGKAEVKIEKKDFEDRLTNADNGEVNISVSGKDVESVIIPENIFTTIQDRATGKPVTIETNEATVSVSSNVIETITEAVPEGGKISVNVQEKSYDELDEGQKAALNQISENAVLFEFGIDVLGSDGKKRSELHELHGTVTLRIPYVMKEGESLTPVVCYIDNGGRKTFIRARYKDGFIEFETDHFSDFAIAMVDSYGGKLGEAEYSYSTAEGKLTLAKTDTSGTFYAAFYEQDGRFISIAGLASANAEIAIPQNADYMKLFLLDANFAPLAEDIKLFNAAANS